MIARYTHPEMGRIWSDQRRYETWLLVETAAAEAMAAAGIIPAEAARDIRERGGVRHRPYRRDRADHPARRDCLHHRGRRKRRPVGAMAPFRHDLVGRHRHGAGAADAGGLRRHPQDLDGAGRRGPRSRDRAPTDADDRPHARRPRRADDLRTEAGALVRGARSRHRTRRGGPGDGDRVGKLPAPSARSRTCRRKSKPTSAAGWGSRPAPVASQVIQRDRHAELLAALAITAASLEKFALEIRGLQKTEIGEVEEPFAKGQKGSSAMPHKRNPIGCEQIVGLARLVRANCQAALREHRALARARHLALVGRARDPARQLHRARSHAAPVYQDRAGHGRAIRSGCARISNRSRGVVFSGTVLLELAQKGVSREQAYEWVQRNAMRSFAEQRDFKALLLADPDITRVLSPRRHRARIRSRRAVEARRRHLRPGLRADVRRNPPSPQRLLVRWG